MKKIYKIVCCMAILVFQMVIGLQTNTFVTSVHAEDTSWQIVKQAYNNHEFNYSDDMVARVQKNVKPTAVENQFQMYLNTETKMTWEDVLGLSSFKIVNNNKSPELPNWPSGGNGGAASWAIPYQQGDYQNEVYVSFYYMENGQKKIISNNVFYYGANKVKNSTFAVGNPFLSISDNYTPNTSDKDPDFGAYAGSNRVDMSENSATNRLMIDVSTLYGKYEFLFSKPQVQRLTDEMGSYIDLGSVVTSGLNTSTSVSPNGNDVLNWDMSKIVLGPIKGEVVNGAFVSDQLEAYKNPNGKISYYRKNAYVMEYLFALKTQKLGFISNHAYPCNTSANLQYTFNNSEKSVPFKVPEVKGLLYEIKIIKKDDETKAVLEGAEFSLYQKKADGTKGNFVEKQTSDKFGKLSFKGLQSGAYIVEETKAPKYYAIGKSSQLKYDLRYNRASLQDKPEGYQQSTEESLVTNERKIGILKISKKVENAQNENPYFQMKITGESYEGKKIVMEFVIKANETVEFELPLGAYVISETVPMEYTLKTYGTNADVVLKKELPEVERNITNVFEHKGYFHSKDTVRNEFKASKAIK